MGSIAVRTELLGKQYRIGVAAARPTNLREAIGAALQAPARNLRRLRGAASMPDGTEPDLIWALRDISFEVQQGEVVGIIGRNGAGKSTLLKLLSRITEPTTGVADIYGRVGSLLEVGTGFHQELTGRDNVYLSGSILGMDRAYIKQRFDEIVEFAGIGPFLDTPVKRYSSGMYLRLAFAVAAHLEPEVLIVDEVLAVGDVEFQQKCLGRMSTVAQEGRTVLFVSHDMNAVRRLCPRAMVLEHGRIQAQGATNDMVQRYLSAHLQLAGPADPIDLSNHPRSGSGGARFRAMAFHSDRGDLGFQPYPDGPLHITLWIASELDRRISSLGVRFCDQHGTILINANILSEGHTVHLQAGDNRVDLRIASLHLKPGKYRVDLRLAEPLIRSGIDVVEAVFLLEVADVQPLALGRQVPGAVTCKVDVLPTA
jgi:lipopolysaccharide transport system ATP-binding protein